MQVPHLPHHLIERLLPGCTITEATAAYRLLHDRWGPSGYLSHDAIEELTLSILRLGYWHSVAEAVPAGAQRNFALREARAEEREQKMHLRYLDQWERDRIRNAKAVSDVGYPDRPCSRATLPSGLSDVG